MSTRYSPAATRGDRATLASAAPACNPLSACHLFGYLTSPVVHSLQGLVPGLAILVAVLLPAAAEAQTTGIMTFSHPGRLQKYVVPASIRQLKVAATRAGGGSPIGRRGVTVVAYLTVTPGGVLDVVVGGRSDNTGANE